MFANLRRSKSPLAFFCGCTIVYIIMNIKPSVTIYRQPYRPGEEVLPLTQHFGRSQLEESLLMRAIQTDREKKFDPGETSSVPVASPLRICCWIMTNPKNLERKARFIQNTWARRCDKSVFISSETNEAFPTVGIDVFEGRQSLTQKTLGGYHYVYHHHLDECDWFFKADDDTYLIVENLRKFLTNHNTEEPMYFGHHFKTILKQGYSSGGSGLVLSKEALRRFGKEGHNPKICRQIGSAGDAALGQCLQNLGVKILNSTDSEGKSTFHCLSPLSHLTGKYPKWYYKYDANGARAGLKSVSDYPISFHYVAGEKQMELNFFLYHAKVADNRMLTTS